MRALVVLALLARVAAADPGDKDRELALGLSIAGTAASTGLFVGGIVKDNPGALFAGYASGLVTPSFGQFYAGQYLTWGEAIRGGAAIGVLAGWSDYACGSGFSAPCKPGQRDDGKLELGLALGAYAAGAIVDIVDAPAAVDRYNRAHHASAAPSPMILTPPSGPVMGAGIVGRF